MSLNIGIGGVWKEVVPGTSIGVGGVNKAVKAKWIGVGGVWKRFFQSFALAATKTVTCGNALGTYTGYSAAGSASLSLPPIGSISPSQTYSDGSSTTRTIADLISVSSTSVRLHLSGLSVPNTDQTFYSLIVNGTTIFRSAAGYSASFDGKSAWVWSSDLPTIPGSGDIEVSVYVVPA